MKVFVLFNLAALTWFVVGCQKASPTSDEKDRVLKVGQAASEALLQNLGGQLKAALQAGGPVAAMQACQQVAPLSTGAIGQNFEGVTLRRTTLKPRNPGNAPDEIDEKVLKMLAASSNRPAEHIEWTETTARYYKPMVIQEICLKCHGNSADFSPELRDKITALYPNDQATGYGLGELRGAIRVDVKR